ncbi:PREDICTED: WASH complex subunit strumpellin-like [Amphimedon queenslandica]|uniref:WASH complex subunit strumpellin n=1 Tax=Amphimedon queenslandica TaxID=400682 RepID=A0A1X7V9U2_AMPQE|nr:PREDICTED: WASH complex subunit strumpellin-like [Amphimedon queenslandica]|eukprot:XP_003385312.1 PREDICTED: WASH complex subunit strumpellin-like [Amphimedon queenslandica]
MDFLDERNVCGQTILKLVSRANAIIAELLRLSQFIPPVLRLDNPRDRQLYEFILPDFRYFNGPEFFESKIDASIELQDRDEEFKENHLEIIKRFFKVFESIYRYVNDLNRFLIDLYEGVYVQLTLESVLLNIDGKQLLSEALYLYGIMLLITDEKIDGLIRERILVAFHRYSAETSVDSNVDDVCKLLRSTGFTSSHKPQNYPEDFFSRIPISDEFISMVIGRLRSDDIYNLISKYPNPEHRSTALANQAAMLYVILYFSPATLHSREAQMREIVDKHFPDNWVISIYMGITIDLLDKWEPYKAARTALANTLQAGNIQAQARRFLSKVPKLNKAMEGYLTEGTLTEMYVLDNLSRLMGSLRDSNATLRWIILHTAPVADHNKKCKMIREEIVQTGYDPRGLFQFLLNVSQFEFIMKEMFEHLLQEKQNKWELYKKEASERMAELGEVFSGTKPLTRVEKNEHLQAWFTEMASQINQLNYEDAVTAGRKITHLHQAVDEVQEFHQLETIMQVKQFLEDTKGYLIKMLRTVNIKEDNLSQLEIIADLSYAWILIDNYTPYMQEGIKKKPQLVIKLRSTFLKMSSALGLPLQRIDQARSNDLGSVSAYYSRELVTYVRKVLQIIPETMFSILHMIVKVLTHDIKEVPTRLEKDKMKEYSQLDDRYKVAKLTHDISVLTEGILMMKTTLVGVIKVDPKQLLEDGIRKELVRQVAGALHHGLIFNPKAKSSELVPRLVGLADRMNGFKRSFEYIQDYVNVYGLKIWQEEISRIINYNVEKECNSFLEKKVLDWESVYQSRIIPIPQYPPVDQLSVNFIGRLAHEILRITDPKLTIYVDQMNTWYDKRTNGEVVNLRLWEYLEKAVDIFGLSGLDRLFCFMIVKEIKYFIKYFKRNLLKLKEFQMLLKKLSQVVRSPLTLIPEAQKTYGFFVQKTVKVWDPYLACVLRVGQLQLIRCQIANQLNRCGKFDSRLLVNALETFNNSLLSAVEAHYRDPDKPYPGVNEQDNDILSELTPYLETTGISDPLSKIYITTDVMDQFSLINFLFVISQLSRLTYTKTTGSLTAKKPVDPIDGAPFVAGCVTLLRQFHSDNSEQCLLFLGQYIKSLMETSKDKGDITGDAFSALCFMEEYAHYSHLPRRCLEQYVPMYLLDEYRYHIN